MLFSLTSTCLQAFQDSSSSWVPASATARGKLQEATAQHAACLQDSQDSSSSCHCLPQIARGAPAHSVSLSAGVVTGNPSQKTL